MKNIDIITFCDQLHESLKSELETVSLETPDVISRASKCLVIVSNVINRLKEFVYGYKFQSSEEEIRFFKELKPVLTSQYYYYDKVFSIKISEPFHGLDSLQSYYHHELNELQDFVKANAEFYRYCLSGSTRFDDKYFIRSESGLNPEVDSKFSTGFDNVLARILACQSVKEFLNGLILKLEINSQDKHTSLRWTGTKSALIELIYSLQSVDAINNGKADIKQIADLFEGVFNISLGNYYRHFQEIRLRKSGKANFLDQLKDKFIQRMDELDQN